MDNENLISDSMILKIKQILSEARKHVIHEVNTALLQSYWEIGRVIVEHEQYSNERAEYGKQTLIMLSKRLTKECGKGFSRSNLQNMRAFYLTYEKSQSVTGKLTWTHYCELLSISEKDRRSFYEKECANAGWSVRELRRQIDSSLFERLLLSSENTNKEKVMKLATKGNEIATPEINNSNSTLFSRLYKYLM